MTKSPSWLFYPNTDTHTAQYARPIHFVVRGIHVDQLELWSNLSISGTWHARSFLHKRNDEYVLTVQDTLPPGEYQYTFRFKHSVEASWSWYGHYEQNRHVHVSRPKRPLIILPDKALGLINEQRGKVDLWHFRTQHNSTCHLRPFNRQSFVACIKKGSCWLTPVTSLEKDQQWQMVLCGEAEQIYLWMIADNGGWMSPGTDDTILLNHHHEGDVILAVTEEEDVRLLVQTAVQYILGHKGKSTKENIMLNKLGYCTWDAFGKTVSADKLNRVLTSLKRKEIPVGYLILDDGWQTVNEKDEMVSMEASPTTFPNGLKMTLKKIKSDYPWIESIGVWHALWGYWHGVEKKLAQKYSHDSSSDISLVKDPQGFYHDFYHFLHASGVDFVKVDNQGAQVTSEERWDLYRQAMLDAADPFFSGHVVHSMALTPHILFHPMLPSGSLIRNSDDFFPHEKESHPWHIYANAINALWTAHLVGDWDMFQSLHPFAAYHATSRAISGGPIYITDEEDKHDATLLYRLVGQTRHEGYTILRCKQPPYPTLDTVFGDPMSRHQGALLQLWNSNNDYRLHGFWNTGPCEQVGIVTTDGWIIGYVVHGGMDEGHVYTLKKGHIMSVRVEGFTSCLISLSPVMERKRFSIACLGLIDKFNGTRAIDKIDEDDQVWLTHRGLCGFWMDKRPEGVKVDGHTVDFDWNEVNGLLKVNMMLVPLHITDHDLFCISIV
ncbi:hypothetical protein INT47_009767 [Mucor saturninus]|uniref:Alpha-galactosidase n=1 Tax=Mucor saturninus TaxID=64648 RepID=A0A8H7QQY1_9FUNG|nr:hypothetical protein INT47_009767 [Mucor saturninus]